MHGGKRPESKEEGDKVMAAWGVWMGKLGAAIVDAGGPSGPSKTVRDGSVESNGGTNPVSGYMIFEAASQDAAVEMAKGCPILEAGTIEVTEVLSM